MKHIFSRLAAALALAAVLASEIRAEESCGCCPQCGCNNLTPVCRLVPAVTKLPKVEYSCNCGDICVPGRSVCIGTEKVTDCNGRCYEQKVYEPCCGKVYKTVTPGKTTTMLEKCTYKCVVEYVCGKCGCGGGGEGRGNIYSPPGTAPPGAQRTEPEHPPHWHRSN